MKKMASKTRYNQKYDYFAEFISTKLEAGWVQSLQREFRDDKFQDNPELMIERIDGFFQERWLGNADPSPDRGNPDTQFNNFKHFLEKNIVNRKKLVFDDPYSKEKDAIDFTDAFKPYREIKGVYEKPKKREGNRFKNLVKVVAPTKMVWQSKSLSELKQDLNRKGVDTSNIKTIEEARDLAKKENVGTKTRKPEILELKEVKPEVAFRKLNKSLESAIKTKNIDKIITIRDIARDGAYKLNNRKLNSFQSLQLVEKADNALKPYYVPASNLNKKSIEEIKESLEDKGIDTTKLKTRQQIESAAKSAGIGLRLYERNKQQLIKKISKLPSYRGEELQNLNEDELKEVLRNLQKNLRRPTTEFFVDYRDLPSERESVKKLFKEDKKKITKKRIEEARKKVEMQFPFMREYMSPALFESEVNRRLAEDTLPFNSSREEINRRYMKWKYGDDTRSPSAQDLIDLSKLNRKQFDKFIKTEKRKVEDPITKREKVQKRSISEYSWRSYKEELKRNSEIRDQIISNRAPEQVEKFETSAVEEALEGLEF